MRRLHGGHQAGVEADPGKLLPRERAGRQRTGEFLHGQVVLCPGRVPAKPAHRSAPVVPHDERVLLCRILHMTEIQELLQGLRLPHVGRSSLLLRGRKSLDLLPASTPVRTVFQGIDSSFPLREAVLPFGGAPRHHDDIDCSRIHTGSQDLFQVRRSRSRFALQVAPAQVKHEGESFAHRAFFSLRLLFCRLL